MISSQARNPWELPQTLHLIGALGLELKVDNPSLAVADMEDPAALARSVEMDCLLSLPCPN